MGRGPRTPRKIGAQPTQLEAVDNSLDPLGPLSDTYEPDEVVSTEQPPVVPNKAAPATTSLREQSSSTLISGSRSMLNSTDVDEEDDHLKHAKGFPTTHPPTATSSSPPQRQTRPSVPVEQAANPRFDITVGDPHKVGDLTSSHIVYQVRTKVCPWDLCASVICHPGR